MTQPARLALSTKLLIFGLDRGTSAADVRHLLGHCKRRLREMGEQVQVDMLEVPGDNNDAFAVVHLWRDPILLWEVSGQINARRFHGRQLQSLVPTLDW